MERDASVTPKYDTATEQKNAAGLKKALAICLAAFERNKEWSDYGHWLQKVAKALTDYPSYQIPEKLTFAKRLAQCLNPNLPPSIHSNAIQVYSLIFRNMKDAGYNWCEDLGLYSIGIFPLFQYSTSKIKPEILQLYRDYYFPMGKQLIPCISGLVVSILPGVEEQNEILQKNVYSTLDALRDCVTKKYFIGAIWMALLRNSKVRIAGIKYFQKKLTRTYIDPEEIEEKQVHSDVDSEEEAQIQQPRESPLIEPPHSELSRSGVTDIQIKEESQDNIQEIEESTKYLGYKPSPEDEAFLRSLNDKNEDSITIEYPNKSSLVINALLACLEDENVHVQKIVLDFLSSHFKLASDLFSENEKHIIIEAVLRLLIKKDQQIQRRVYTWVFGPPDTENKYQVTEKNAFVMDYLITAFINLFNKVPNDLFQVTLPLKVLQNFYMEHDHLVEQTLGQLAIPFLSYISKYSQPGYDFADEVHKSGARFMENITSYFSTLLTSLSQSLEIEINNQNNERCLEIINLIEFTFKLEASIANKELNINYIEQKDYLKAIISGILRSTSSIAPDQKNLIPFMDTALNLNLTLIDKLEKVDQDLLKLITERNLSEAEVAKIMQPRPSDYTFVDTLELFSKFYDKLVKQVLSFQSEGEMSQKILDLFAAASETIVRIQIFHLENNLNGIPSWLHSVLQCIKSSFPSVAIIGIKTIQNLLVIKSKSPIYESLKSLIRGDDSTNQGNDIVSGTVEKLWRLLDIHYIQTTVSELLVTFQTYFPSVFAEIVSNSFQVPSITEKEAAIRRFASFWKMSNDMPKSEFIDSGTGLFLMLDSLDNDNPLLRHSSKSWLLDSVPFLYRIIDPVFEILMQTNSAHHPFSEGHHLRLYTTETQQYFFTEVYDTDLVQDCFKKLKSILITSSELFIRYIISIRISEKLRNYTQFFVNNGFENTESCTYLDLLVVLCLRYIQGQAIESLSPKFQIQNATVNASASEFMELLVSHVENKELSAKMTHFIMEPLLLVLNHSINNTDYVLQVQLLNLLRVILFQSSFCKYEGTQTQCVALLSSKRFIPNLLQGLGVDQTYVRVQYINFISLCVEVLTQNIPQKEVLTSSVISILRAYFEIILSKHLEVSENNDEFEPWETDNVNFEEDVKNKKIEMTGDEAKKTEESKSRGTRNTFTIRYQSQNEIYILLEGVKKILDYFLKFKQSAETLSETKPEEIAPGVFSTVMDIVKLQFLFRQQEQKQEVVSTTNHPETSKAILNDLFRTVYIFIYCWRLSKEFRNNADFTTMGITPYTFEKYNDINKMIKDYHMKIDVHAKNVKSLVISVFKPLMAQYTTETVNSLINYWLNECQKKRDLSINPRIMKEIEILISMNVSIDSFIESLSKNQIVLDLSNYYVKKQQQNKKAPIILNYDVDKTESQIFFLLSTYIAFSHIDINFLKKDYLLKLWTTMLNFTKLFINSKSVSTQLWILEILFLLSQKYNPKEVLGDYKIKKEMHGQINGLLVAVATTFTKHGLFFFNEIGSGSNGRYKTVTPFPPSVYEIYKSYVQKNQTHSPTGSVLKSTMKIEQQDVQGLLDSIEVDRLMFENFTTDNAEQSLYDRYRLFAFKTLKRVALTLMQNTYSPERMDRIIIRMKEFMDVIFPLMENKSPENQPFLECASELLYAQLEASRSFLIKDYKKSILDIFNGNDFFKCTKQTLKYWSKIIDWVVTMDKTDLFSEFLTKVSTFSFLYSKDSETKQKIKSFERICFIIYSGERDKYQDKLYILLEKMGEVIKNADSAHPSLLILVLFCIRILILRLTPSSLNELFRHIWPILLTLMMQIFNKKNSQKNPNLMLAALKLLEMMSIVQLEEFFINQWVFIFDYFGITIEPRVSEPNLEVPVETVEGRDSGGAVEGRSKISGFIYQPYITSALQEDLKINYKNQQIETQKDCNKVERKIVMTMTNVDDEVEIRAKSLFLLQYLIQQNEFRTEVDPHQVESLIEGDFISLDDYIFNLS